MSWKQCLSDNQAWDTLTWFAALIAMAAYLNKYGFITWFSDKVGFGFLIRSSLRIRLAFCLVRSHLSPWHLKQVRLHHRFSDKVGLCF